MKMELKDAVSNIEYAMSIAKFPGISIPEAATLQLSFKVIKEHCLPERDEAKEGNA